MTNCEYCGGSGDVHTIDGEWRGECPVCSQTSTVTPETREELARAFERCLERHGVGIGAVEGTLDDADAIAPIIERMVAARVAAAEQETRESVAAWLDARHVAVRSMREPTATDQERAAAIRSATR